MRTSFLTVGLEAINDVGRGSSWLGVAFIKAGPTKLILRTQSSFGAESPGVVFVMRSKLKVVT